ncbi:hypothetical protein [Streptococcus suis]|uniref:hypothetical protein n=1 Tax=Streptococcus suis TaxID=1307 RepID=UPI001FCA1DD0
MLDGLLCSDLEVDVFSVLLSLVFATDDVSVLLACVAVLLVLLTGAEDWFKVARIPAPPTKISTRAGMTIFFPFHHFFLLSKMFLETNVSAKIFTSVSFSN